MFSDSLFNNEIARVKEKDSSIDYLISIYDTIMDIASKFKKFDNLLKLKKTKRILMKVV